MDRASFRVASSLNPQGIFGVIGVRMRKREVGAREVVMTQGDMRHLYFVNAIAATFSRQ